jgi:diguanylate cyclase (GGDEF)-like protein
MINQEFEAILSSLKLFERMYESIRLVDPALKQVLNFRNNALCDTDIFCYTYWGRNEVCDSCIAMRAFKENKTFVKLEYEGERIFLVTAIPLELYHRSRRVVLELLKDITHCLVVDHELISKNDININYSLNDLVIKDALTSLYNRRYINERLPADIVNMTITNQHLTIILADIDFFKKVNDTYGHLVGDEVLKAFSELLVSCLKRESDWVGRFGGEEFLICLPGAKPEKAREIAEFMRKKIESTPVKALEHTLNITASFGVCSMKPSQAITPDAYIGCADENLYKAKQGGRNRVEG